MCVCGDSPDICGQVICEVDFACAIPSCCSIIVSLVSGFLSYGSFLEVVPTLGLISSRNSLEVGLLYVYPH